MIEPALTAEEWRGGWARTSAPHGEDWAYLNPYSRSMSEGIDGWVSIGGENGCGDSVGVNVPREDRHALAALCLHGQPFGFTWEMLRAIQLKTVRDGTPEAFLVAAACERIAALLPPREG
jgi:hypothetical protein